jgi:flagellar biosynthesis protein FliR
MVGFPVKILLTLAMVGMALPLLPSTVSSLLASALRAGTNITSAFGG